MFLDAEGEIVGKHAEANTVEAFARTAANVQRWRELKRKAAAGDAKVKIDIAILECALGVLDYWDLEDVIEGQELSADQKKAVTLCRVNAEVAEGVQLARAGSIDDVVEDFLEIYKKGVFPTQNTYGFWSVLLHHGNVKGDVPILEASIAALKKVFGPDNERANKRLAKFETRLAELKEAQK